ncbi:ABC transporter ATP-binding protein [Niveibacterium sp. 24ML]|uniref:ABC transporter ATP-binding protein n=1 Tax=Niveibacterium sp. 24ML TaxID=2985512 RepID=UPI002270AB36|nr:ABC transporter ATP-binding protein [Niveibacterium sp. 24ML]MCX9158406.1 ABC transporter ATP-binding protein [Niveibacterium sp. 24ML]
MGSISLVNVGKAYKHYPDRWSRLVEWLLPDAARPLHQLKWVLQDVSFTIRPGEAVGIVGVNGAGKSTLLKMITGTTQPTTGQIRVTGRIAALLELGMGFHPDFTGRQNVIVAGQLQGLTGDQMQDLMPAIEAFAEIGEYIDEPLRVYSSGMQVRLAFAVATAVRPDILIVDEALSVGDARFQAKCYARVADFKAQGTTLLLVTHSVGDVVKHCDRALLLKNGRLEMDGASRDVTNRYLDELFGKASNRSGADEVESVVSSSLSSDGVDRFHERSSYRKEEHRWGGGGAAIIDYEIVADGKSAPAQIESGALVDFYFKVRFDIDVTEVVPGILVKSLEGIFLFGTNSFLASEGKTRIGAGAGEVRVFRFSMPMRLNEGHYLVSFGISSGDPQGDLTPIDRRYDSVLVHVYRQQPFWGIVDLTSTFEDCSVAMETTSCLANF